MYSVGGCSVPVKYSGGCDLPAKVIILLFAHKKKKAKKESSKELYGELIVTISNPVAMFLMKLFWSFKALNAHSHDQGQCFMKCWFKYTAAQGFYLMCTKG